MMREVVKIYLHSDLGKWAQLSCGHTKKVPETMVTKNKIVVVHCEQCAKAEALPDTVREIWEKYWHGIPRF